MLRLYWKYAIFSKRDFQRKKTHPYQQTIAEVDLTFFNKGWPREQEFTAKEVAKSEWASAGEESETVLNNAVNYSESGVSERR